MVEFSGNLSVLLGDLSAHIKQAEKDVSDKNDKLSALLDAVEAQGGGQDASWSRSVVIPPPAQKNVNKLGHLQLGGADHKLDL